MILTACVAAACVAAAQAVEVDSSLIEEGEKLKVELEEEKKEREAAEKAEAERVEREAATEELQAAIKAVTSSRDANGLSKPIKRAKKVQPRPWRRAHACHCRDTQNRRLRVP